MFRLFFIIITIAGLTATPFLTNMQGTVIVDFLERHLVMSVFEFCAIWIASLLLIYLVEFLYTSLNTFFYKTAQSLLFFKKRRAKKSIKNGIVFLKEGNYKKAHRIFKRNVKYIEDPLILLIDATKAAEKNQDYKSANEFLKQAEKLTAADNLMLSIAKIELLMSMNELKKAEDLITLRLQKYPRNVKLLSLAFVIYDKQKNYDRLHMILPAIKQQKLLNEEDYNSVIVSLSNDFYANNMEHEYDPQTVMKLYKNQSIISHLNPLEIKLMVIKKLLSLNETDDSNNLIYKSLTEFHLNKDLWNNLLDILLNNIEKIRKKLIKPLATIYSKDKVSDIIDHHIKLIRILAILNNHNKNYKQAKLYFDRLIENNNLTDLREYQLAIQCYKTLSEPEKVEILQRDFL